MHACPLCSNTNSQFYHQDKIRIYWQCTQCSLVFVEQQYLPSLAREKKEYALHNNDFEDQGYCRYLMRIIDAVKEVTDIKNDITAIDFGSGPNPVLAHLMKDKGFQCQYYDPIFAPNPEVLSQHYDLITCTEAIEHFHQPSNEWQLWQKMLKPGGWLAIMTKRVIDLERFKSWHYKNDITHVSFFSNNTFNWLAAKDGYRCFFPQPDIVLMQKID